MNRKIIKQAEKLRQSGLSYRAIGKSLGFSSTSIQRWLNPAFKLYKISAEARIRYRKTYTDSLVGRCKQALARIRWAAKRYKHTPCITPVEAIMEKFTACCDLCGAKEKDLGKRLALDHNHITGAFRGWLCDNCNRSLRTIEVSPTAILNYLGR